MQELVGEVVGGVGDVDVGAVQRRLGNLVLGGEMVLRVVAAEGVEGQGLAGEIGTADGLGDVGIVGEGRAYGLVGDGVADGHATIGVHDVEGEVGSHRAERQLTARAVGDVEGRLGLVVTHEIVIGIVLSVRSKVIQIVTGTHLLSIADDGQTVVVGIVAQHHHRGAVVLVVACHGAEPALRDGGVLLYEPLSGVAGGLAVVHVLVGHADVVGVVAREVPQVFAFSDGGIGGGACDVTILRLQVFIQVGVEIVGHIAVVVLHLIPLRAVEHRQVAGTVGGVVVVAHIDRLIVCRDGGGSSGSRSAGLSRSGGAIGIGGSLRREEFVVSSVGDVGRLDFGRRCREVLNGAGIRQGNSVGLVHHVEGGGQRKGDDVRHLAVAGPHGNGLDGLRACWNGECCAIGRTIGRRVGAVGGIMDGGAVNRSNFHLVRFVVVINGGAGEFLFKIPRGVSVFGFIKAYHTAYIPTDTTYVYRTAGGSSLAFLVAVGRVY